MTRRRRGSRLEEFGNWLALVLVLGAVGSCAFVYWRWEYRERRFDRLIEEVASKYGVDRFLVKAVIRRESKFDPFVYGSHGEIGLMQVTDGAGQQWARAVKRRDYGRSLLWDPQVNIEAGTWYLARAMGRWPEKDPEERIPFALAEYNAGYANVLRWLPHAQQTTPEEFVQAISYPSVRDYVADVMENYQFYKARGQL
ncbi:MAG TPA: transglycosylase SLT domain-containing protein [Verrucomicrobiae bacterium]|nr:transglycosylase SLT domain-containing protein [Verrucomicrobiae bacterium]